MRDLEVSWMRDLPMGSLIYRQHPNLIRKYLKILIMAKVNSLQKRKLRLHKISRVYSQRDERKFKLKRRMMNKLVRILMKRMRKLFRKMKKMQIHLSFLCKKRTKSFNSSQELLTQEKK